MFKIFFILKCLYKCIKKEKNLKELDVFWRFGYMVDTGYSPPHIQTQTHRNYLQFVYPLIPTFTFWTN